MSGPVAVIDIGSNSIKALVAERLPDGSVGTRHAQTLDARISAGIGEEVPRLSEEGMSRGVSAIRTLLEAAAPYSPGRTVLVATSAVRDAANGAEFRSRVLAATGHEIRILRGDEEARLIGAGLTCDPALRHLDNFYVFDLGGGSLECLSFAHRRLDQALSLQLGCVRLMEQFVANPSRPFGRIGRYRVMQHVHDELVRSAFSFSLAPGAFAVGTGGTMTTARAMLGAQSGLRLDQTDAYVPATQLRLLLSRVARLPLEERQQIPGLPSARADVFPTALATFIVLADVAAVPGFHHSLYNLRYGLAAEMLAGA